ncbi:uncharacterized protein LOC135487672 [Lineus longissimus]|uniref:uncharacterized protein LOC135487672 n=1 Tax=Lineus longissimus TaxID=88925 RepID=UPI00315D2B36
MNRINIDPSVWFRLPVNKDDAQGYFDLIQHPMDFSTIQGKIKKKATRTGWDIGMYRRAQKEAKLDIAHASAMKMVQSQVEKLDDDIREKEECIRDLTAEIEWKERLES